MAVWLAGWLAGCKQFLVNNSMAASLQPASHVLSSSGCAPDTGRSSTQLLALHARECAWLHAPYPHRQLAVPQPVPVAMPQQKRVSVPVHMLMTHHMLTHTRALMLMLNAVARPVPFSTLSLCPPVPPR